MPNTRPNLVIDPEGNCNCKFSLDAEVIDWGAREREFQVFVSSVKQRGKDYDCVIPVSGGKDSTWQVSTALAHDLKPLCITWKTPGRTPIGQQNLDNLIDMGVTHFDVTLNPRVERTFTRQAFESLGIPALPMHMAIHALPLQVALKFDVPCVIYGENSAFEYGGAGALKGSQLSERWVKDFGVTGGTSISDWVGSELSDRDLQNYARPSEQQLSDAGLAAVFLGYYFDWDPEATFISATQSGFKPAEQPEVGLYHYADIDESFLMTVHHWLKWYKFGFTRVWDNLSIEIREGRLSREEALMYLRSNPEPIPTQAITRFADYIDISVSDFFKIADRFRNTDIWVQDPKGQWFIKDFLISDWQW